jgi:sugar lactone lactonase YvrE
MSPVKSYQDLYAEHTLSAGAQLGEGAVWDWVKQKLYWVDIEGRMLHIYDPVTKEDISLSTGERVGTVVPLSGDNVLVALQTGIHKMHTGTGALKLIINPPKDPGTRFNDGKCDPEGRFWVGTISPDRKPNAALYCLDYNMNMRLVLSNITNSNGIAWSSDKTTMYYIDTPTRLVQAFDYNHTSGLIKNPRIAIRIPEGMGSPDGMTIDQEDKLWIALWGAGTVARFDANTGKLLQSVKVPAPNTSSCAFGDKDLKTLYITTARHKLSDKELDLYPLSGDLFEVKPGISGIKASFYAGNL